MAKTPPWYAAEGGLRFGCHGCGGCCREAGFVWLTRRDVQAMARHLGLSSEAFGRQHLRQVGRRLATLDGPDGACIFWREGEGCRVYPVRPAQCRTFPFWPEHTATAEGWADAARRCPGVGEGRLYPEPEIDALGRRDGATDDGRPAPRGDCSS